MYQSEQINEIAKALSNMQAELEPVKKTKTGMFKTARYAPLDEIWEMCRTPLKDNGLAITQTLDCKDGDSFLRTTLVHVTGQWISSLAPIAPTKNDIHGFCSALTYMKRYSLAAILGISTDDDKQDDDGKKAVETGVKPRTRPPGMGIILAEQLIDLAKERGEIYMDNFHNLITKKYPDYTKLSLLPSQAFVELKKIILQKVVEAPQLQGSVND